MFGISPREADCERRGFAPTTAARRARLELIGRTFIAGYNASLAAEDDRVLEASDPELRGFVVEGSAMACAILDHLTPWRRDRIARLLEARPEHVYMIHVGAGWATARLRGSLARAVARRDRLLGWLVADGWGFHQTYFHPKQWAAGRGRLRTRDSYLGRAVDQGVGRALWFVAGADPERVAEHVARFDAERRADLWSGIGLAATYAGGVDREALVALVARAAQHREHLAQGAAFAAAARSVAGNPAPHADLAAHVIAGRSAEELAWLALTLEPRPADRHHDAYETWRAQIRRAVTLPEAA